MNLNATILGQAFSFMLFVWFCMKYIWPPIILAIETRQKEITTSLINAKKAQEELELIQKQIKDSIIQAKEKAVTIINDANKQKVVILEEAKKKSIEESKKIFLKQQSDIQIDFINKRKELHNEIVDLAILMAEKIIQKNIQKSNHEDLIEEWISKISQVKN